MAAIAERDVGSLMQEVQFMTVDRSRRYVLSVLTAGVALLGARTGRAQIGPRNRSLNAESGVALRGYDVVAYFAEGAPRHGSAEFAHSWNGAEWRFASAGNRDSFAADPARYAPQYGGYCAYAMAQGYFADVEPEAFSVVNGKLFLNANLRVRSRWLGDVPGYVAQADRNWPRLSRAG